MNTGATKLKPLRRGHGAVLIPVERVDAWYALASATPGMNDVERGVLSAIAEHFRRLHAGMRLSYDRIAHHLDVDSVQVKWAVYRLVELGLVAVQPGAGPVPNEYLPALPKRLAASLLAVPAEEVPTF
jgi:hypothetical protein